MSAAVVVGSYVLLIIRTLPVDLDQLETLTQFTQILAPGELDSSQRFRCYVGMQHAAGTSAKVDIATSALSRTSRELEHFISRSFASLQANLCACEIVYIHIP